MGRIVDIDGKEIKDKTDKQAGNGDIDPYTQKTLQAINTLREMLAKTTSDLDLTFFQVLGAVTSLQAQLVSTLMQREHSQMLD